MGGTTSMSVTRDVVNESFSAIDNTAQSCVSNTYMQELLKANGAKNCSFSNIDYSNQTALDIQCLQNVSNSSTISTAIQQAITNSASTIDSSFNLNPDTASADSIMKLVTNVVESIVNTTTQNCTNNTTSIESLVANNCNNSQFYNIDFDSLSNAIRSCGQSTADVNSEASTLQQTLKNMSSVEREGLFGGLGFLILLVAGIILWILYKGVQVLTNPTFITTVILVVCVYVAIAYFLGWEPYSNSWNNQTSDWYIFLGSIIVGVVDLGILLWLLFRKK